MIKPTGIIDILPLWFRNTWGWDKDNADKPGLDLELQTGNAWSVKASHSGLGEYHLYGKQAADLLFTENENNRQRLWGCTNATPYVKDSFHSYVIESRSDAINPAHQGTMPIRLGRGISWELYMRLFAPPQ